jgi:hypothetical protein
MPHFITNVPTMYKQPTDAATKVPTSEEKSGNYSSATLTLRLCLATSLNRHYLAYLTGETSSWSWWLAGCFIMSLSIAVAIERRRRPVVFVVVVVARNSSILKPGLILVLVGAIGLDPNSSSVVLAGATGLGLRGGSLRRSNQHSSRCRHFVFPFVWADCCQYFRRHHELGQGEEH